MKTFLRRRTRVASVALVALAVACSTQAAREGEDVGSQRQAAISTSLSTYAVGSNVVVNFDTMSGAASDWVAISETGTADDKFIKWQYTAGEIAGSRTFSGLPGGSYEARAYFNWAGTSSYTVQYRSSFTISGTGAPVLTPPGSIAVNAPIQIAYSGLPGNRTDWIAVAVPGSPATSFLRWSYTNGATSGTTNFAGLPAGSYVARAFYDYQNTSSFAVQAEAPFTVAGGGGSPTVTPPASPLSSTPINVAFANFPGYPTDWVAVAVAGSPDSTFIRYKYTDGALSGTAALGTLADGAYEARGYANWAGTSSYNVIARQAFTVGSGSADAGSDATPDAAPPGTTTIAYTGAITTFTVPNGVTSLRIQASGAQGGTATTAGGLGAEMAGTFAVTPGQQLRVLVGQQPVPGNGGGGGTFVVRIPTGVTLIAAGGGGGGAGECCGGQVAGSPGVVAANGTPGTSPGCAGGAGGVGGAADQGLGGNATAASGGGGLVNNGGNGSGSSPASFGGASFQNGGAGGTGPRAGGFGGGGAASNNGGWTNGAGGGGGGYAGGGGGCGASQWGSGGGGGSFNGGTSQTNTSGTRSGNGQVIFTW